MQVATREVEVLRTMFEQGLRSTGQSRVVGQILHAATEAVSDHGLDGLSMEDVAVRAGCSRATVYRRVGGKDAIRDAVLDEALIRITALVARAVAHLEGRERLTQVLVASLDVIRTDPVSAALLTGPAAGQSASTALITQFTGTIAEMAGIDLGDGIDCELFSRVTLALLCWPPANRATELAIIDRYVGGFGLPVS